MVWGAWLASASAWGGASRTREARRIGVAGGADWRRQDGRGISAEPDRTCRRAGAAQVTIAHALHLAAQGARGRRVAQSRNPCGGDGTRRAHRNAHGRHAAIAPPPAAPHAARHSSYHAGATRVVAGFARLPALLRQRPRRGARRTACI